MRLPIRKALVFSALLLGIVFIAPGNLLHVPSAGTAEAAGALPQAQYQSASTPSPSATLAPTNTLAVLPTATPLPPISIGGATPTIYAFIQAPQGALTYPYVTISGFSSRSFSANLRIVGSLNLGEFSCAGSPCIVPLELGESRIAFKAVLDSGQESESILARVLATQESDGYHVRIESVSQYFGTGSDACLRTWGVENEEGPSWAQFPQSPFELNTRTTLHYLITRLIVGGLVDTRDCPAGGLSSDLTWPNGCGVEKARTRMIEWQNQYDDAIWATGNTIGIPPRILKTLIQVESQFWPGNQRFYVDEFGLGQINQLGVDVLLRRDDALYQQVCSTVLTHCFTSYAGLSPSEQAMVRGALVSSLNSVCPTCANGIDFTKARQSITFVAQVLKANCQQVKVILDSRSAVTDYESYWKFTLYSYHAGMSCLDQDVKAVKQAGLTMDWENLSEESSCQEGVNYVNGFWSDLTSFDANRYSLGSAPIVQFSPVFVTRTPLPSPTPITSSATVSVGVYMDANKDGTPQPSEGLDGITVQLELPDGRILTAVTKAGQAQFSLSGQRIGLRITASLPGLYRSYRFFVPQGGTVPVVFMFDQPILPNTLP